MNKNVKNMVAAVSKKDAVLFQKNMKAYLTEKTKEEFEYAKFRVGAKISKS